jgi:uncharacterized protein (UPF0333 family)
MKKISIIIGVLILAGVGFYFYTQNSKKAIAPSNFCPQVLNRK